MFARVSRTFALTAFALFAGAASLAAQDKKSMPICKDGTTSTVSGRGACSGHKGVDSAATKAAKDAAKADKAQAKADKAKKTKDPEKAALAQAKAEQAQAKADKAEDKAAKDSAGATAQCKDGTYSHAKSTKGACSRHGGVAKTLKP